MTDGAFSLHTGLFRDFSNKALILSRIPAYTEGMTTNTNTTPGYNCRLRIYFTTDNNGRKRARYYGTHHVFRSFPLPLVDAELFIAQGLADLIDGPR